MGVTLVTSGNITTIAKMILNLCEVENSSPDFMTFETAWENKILLQNFDLFFFFGTNREFKVQSRKNESWGNGFILSSGGYSVSCLDIFITGFRMPWFINSCLLFDINTFVSNSPFQNGFWNGFQFSIELSHLRESSNFLLENMMSSVNLALKNFMKTYCLFHKMINNNRKSRF